MLWPISPRAGRVVATGLVGGLLGTTLVYGVISLAAYQPIGVVLGLEPQNVYLRRQATNYGAMKFIRSNLLNKERVLMLWDGQGYYCDERCLPDTEHSRWTLLVNETPNAAHLAAKLSSTGITHLLFNIRDADFILQHDPTGQHRRAAEFFIHQFQPTCTSEIYRDEWMSLYEITCQDQKGQSE
jgi:hypothetical protein